MNMLEMFFDSNYWVTPLFFSHVFIVACYYILNLYRIRDNSDFYGFRKLLRRYEYHHHNMVIVFLSLESGKLVCDIMFWLIELLSK